jgi:hypothetical protein
VKYVAVYQRWWQFEIQYRKFLFTDFCGQKVRVGLYWSVDYTDHEWKDKERKP